MSKTVQKIPAQEHAGMTEEVHVWMTKVTNDELTGTLAPIT